MDAVEQVRLLKASRTHAYKLTVPSPKCDHADLAQASCCGLWEGVSAARILGKITESVTFCDHRDAQYASESSVTSQSAMAAALMRMAIPP